MIGQGIYFDAITVQRNCDTGTVTVLTAPKVAAISPEMYDRAVAGEFECLHAGEGLFVITATNGTFRYRLTGDFESYSHALIAEKFDGPTLPAGAS